MWPVLLKAGPVTIYSLGLCLFLGFWLSCFVIWKQARVQGLPEEKIFDTLFLTTFLAILAGRLGFVFSHWPNFASDYSRIIFFFKYPGLSLPTFIILAILISALLSKSAGLEVLLTWDIFALSGAFFAVFGYLGYFLDTGAGLSPFFLALALAGFFLVLRRKLTGSAALSEQARKRGLFFLCYLIFQFISLLMTTGVMLYALPLVLVIVILVGRYQDLFKYVYHSISQRRFSSN